MEEHRPTPIEKLTIAGRILLVVTLLMFIGGFCSSFLRMADRIPASGYSIVIMLLPALTGCVCFFFCAAWLLERCGLRIYASTKIQMGGHNLTAIERLTIAGRILFAVTLLIFSGGLCSYVLFLAKSIPQSGYPLIVVVMPVFLACFFFFLIVAWLLERRGIRIYAKRAEK